jgi:DNA-binding beta-propeller fold protein YncE
MRARSSRSTPAPARSLHALLRGSTRTGSRTTPSGATSFVSDESGGVETVLNAGGHRIATIQLGGEAGNVQYDAGSGRVLADVQTRNDIAVIDPRTNRIVRRVLAFDTSLRRLYVAAESGEVAVFAEHARGLAKLGQAELAPYAHTVAVDPRTHLVYFPLQRGSTGRPQLLIMAPQ